MRSLRHALWWSLVLAGAPDAVPAEPAPVRAADVATRLGRPPRFLIGMGNDLANDHNQDGAYTLGVTLDLHYAYLVGLPGQGGWPDWNAGGTFVNILTDTADDHGVVPMFTLYQMAAWGEGNIGALTNARVHGALLVRGAPALRAAGGLRQAGGGPPRARLLGIRTEPATGTRRRSRCR